MKKFYMYPNEETLERNTVYFDFENSKFADILGVTYICETGGNPVTDAEDDAPSFEELLEQAETEIMDTDADDEEYITEQCEAWGLIPRREEEDEDE